MGDEIGADGVVVHPGSTVGEPHATRRWRGSARCCGTRSRSRTPAGCCSRTPPGAGNTLGRSFEELRELVDLAGGDKRIGICLDSCHMLASGFDIRTADKLAAVIDGCVEDRRACAGCAACT